MTSKLLERPGRDTQPSATAFDRRLIAPMILGSVLNPINSSMIAVALVPIGIAFGAPPAETVWLVSALYLATAVGQPVIGRLVDMYGPRRLYLVHSGSPVWLLLAVLGVPQGLIGLAAQTALYRQADPARIASAAGLLRTFMYLGALGASAATAAFFPHRADTAGLHGLALFLVAGSALLLATTLVDRSLGSLTPRETTRTTARASARSTSRNTPGKA
ncbi:MFS transporter [Streptomyces sp. NPDC002619]|uniref:MFS transporter n=1 Tax=Streptomyces sp. NPDC002619 TaxID=3364655 RepID=UPI00369D00AC